MLKNAKLVIATSLFALLSTAGLAAAGNRFAGPGGEGRKEAHARLRAEVDYNHDGQLDETERAALHEKMRERAQQRRAEMLGKFDANRDGKLDDAERGRMHDQMARERFQKLDRDGNGVVTFEEFKAGAKDRHARMGHGRKGKVHARGPGATRGRR
ncbi:MAG: EF-hand domain-containing protein [Kofleriaceae bacterium]